MARIWVWLLVLALLTGCGGPAAETAPSAEAPEEVEAPEAPVWRGETRPDGRRCEGRLAACGEGGGRVAVRVTGGPGETFFQELTLEEADLRTMPSGAAHWEDVNFDGAPDVLVHIGGGRGGGMSYAALLWDGDAGAYREEPTYADIYQPVPDPAHQIVWDGYDVSSEYHVAAWEVRDGAFLETHRLTITRLGADGDQGIVYAESAPDGDGGWAEVNRVEVRRADAGWDHPEAYLAAPPVWEGWARCDFQRFRQLG